MGKWLVIAVVVLLGSGGCGDWPKDPGGTAERVRGGTMRVGVSVSPPWTLAGEPPGGVEAEAVEALASRMGATVAWRIGGEEALLRELEGQRLDLVIGGLTASNPWGKHVGFTRPFVVTERDGKVSRHVWAAPPGENGWLMAVERFLHAERGALRESAARAGERVR